MAQDTTPTSIYTFGHSEATLVSHSSRTVDSDAGFLLPHIRPSDHLLDVGCGPGTITLGFLKYATEGKVTGIDVGDAVLDKARAAAAEAGLPPRGPGSVAFEKGDCTNLRFANNTFDIVFASQLFTHIPPPDLLLKALSEMRRVLKPGGILATRDAADVHFYPRHLDLDRLWTRKVCKAIHQGAANGDLAGAMMPTFVRQAGFGLHDGKVTVGGGTTVYSSAEARRWWAASSEGRLRKGEAVRDSWLAAGETEAEIDETIDALRRWGALDGAWYGTCPQRRRFSRARLPAPRPDIIFGLRTVASKTPFQDVS